MFWRLLHRWLGLVAGSVALVLALTGVILALQAAVAPWQAAPAAGELPIATLVDRVTATIAQPEQIRRLPSGDIVVYAFDSDQPVAQRIDPADGRVLGPYQASAASRWIRNLHRTLLLGDGGRLAAAATALAMLALAISGLALTARRLGGWRRLAARVRGSTLQRLHVVSGRLVVGVLLLSSVTALYMSAATFGLIPSSSDFDPDVASTAGLAADLPGRELLLLQDLRVGELRKLTFPSADDPQDTWQVTTTRGEGWIDRHTGATLEWATAPAAQRIHDWVVLLHTGEGASAWALVLGAMGGSIVLFWATGLLLWWQARRQMPVIRDNSAPREAEVLIFVASENGATWGFAEALHRALVQAGQRVHTAALEQFQCPPTARHILVLAATYGEGQPPAHAARALERIAAQPVGAASASVLGFGDRQFGAYCAFADAVERELRARGWRELLPLERIHQQSAQQFSRWGEALAAALDTPLAIDYVPRVPPTTMLRLTSRQDFAGELGAPAAILRFELPGSSGLQRLLGHALPHFAAGDLIGIMAPGETVARYYSLASGWHDGFIEICVRLLPGGVCSAHLHALRPGDAIAAFIKPNPGFALEASRRPVLLIGAGTGVAPLAGFIRGNRRRSAMHLFFGVRDPARDFYFGREIERWLGAGQLASLRTAFSRTADGGGYVQDALRRDAERVRALIGQGASIRVCGSRPMARGVVDALDDILAAARLSVRQLKAGGRYAEDVF